jgi:prepilin-type processing-associated H-X9-DG protein
MRRGLFVLLLLSACNGSAKPAPEPASFCNQRVFDGSRFTVCSAPGGAIELVAAAPGEQPVRRFDALEASLGKRAASVAFAMNAGMYGTDGRPIGLAIVNGREVRAVNRRKGGGNFHLMPNGIFQVMAGGKASVVTTDKWQPSKAVRTATQSGPMLVIDGKLHPAFDRDGTSRYVRNGVGIGPGGEALFVISQDPVSLGKFARFYRDGLKSRNALFFDGSVSALWDPANHRRDMTDPLGPMVVVFKPR